jgi:hypothetical protein
VNDNQEKIFRDILKAFYITGEDKKTLERQLRASFELDENESYQNQIEAKLGRELKPKEVFALNILEKLNQKKASTNRRRRA